MFIESDLVHHQQRGAEKDDLIAGLSYSIVQNYLNRVVGDRQGAIRIFGTCRKQLRTSLTNLNPLGSWQKNPFGGWQKRRFR